MLMGLLFTLAPLALVRAQGSDCSNALPATLDNFNNLSTSASGVNPVPSCYPGAQYNVWVQLTAPASGHIMLSNFYQVQAVAVYSGACGSLTEIGCYVVQENQGQVCSRLEISTLTPGSTYYIQALYNNSQSTSGYWLNDVASGSANDLCSGAVPITLGTIGNCPTGQISGTTVNARHNVDFSCASGYQCHFRDVWYSFTAPASGNVKFTPGTGNPVSMLFSGNCNALQPVGCIHCGDGFLSVTPGQTYYLAVATYEENGVGQNFTFCLEETTSQLTNNSCSGATPIAVSSTGNCSTVSGNTAEADLSMPFPCSFGSSELYLDVWYSFTAPPGGKVTFHSGAGNPFAVIYSGNCNSLSTVANGCMRGSGTVSGLTPGNTYYLQVLTMGCDGGAFDFCLESSGAAPTNNNCNNAIGVSLNTPVPVNSIYALTTQLPPCAPLPTLNAPSMWYSFTGTTDGMLGISFSGGVLPVTIFSGSCGNLSTLACAVPLASGPPDNLVPGQTYYAMVSSLGATTNGSITLSGSAACTPTTWYQDLDGDGKGNPNISVQACDQPPGYVSNSLDCDDNSATACPKPSGLQTTNVTNNSATVSWGYLACATKYRLEYRRKTKPVSSWVIVYTTVPTYNLVGLTGPNIQYQWRVATICSPDGTGAESGYAAPIQSFYTHYIAYPDGDGDGHGEAMSSSTFVHPFPQPGYSLNANDCDDTNNTIFPGATELCNGEDDDCDMVIDEGMDWYQDSDGDGLGDAAITQNVCLQPEGYVDNDADCNDASTTAVCGNPSGGVADPVTSTTAQLNWIELPCASYFQVQYRVTGTNTFTPSINVSDNSYLLTGLMPNTAYQARVRSRCVAPNPATTSAWVYIFFSTVAPLGLEGISAPMQTISGEETIRIFPNPGDGRFTLQLVTETAGPGTLFVFDGLGQLVFEDRIEVVKGANVFHLDLSQLSVGWYHMLLQQGDKRHMKQVLISR